MVRRTAATTTLTCSTTNRTAFRIGVHFGSRGVGHGIALGSWATGAKDSRWPNSLHTRQRPPSKKFTAACPELNGPPKKELTAAAPSQPGAAILGDAQSGGNVSS
jgi:hypothetical protein